VSEVLFNEEGAARSELEFWESSSREVIWQRYCGFLDLSLGEFMIVQERNLLDQIELVANSPLAREIMNNRKPATVDEFRQLVPLTTYEDYAAHLEQSNEAILPKKPYYWARTSGREGNPKWVPFSIRADEVTCRNAIGAALLASAKQKGDINVWPGEKMMFNLPGRPYFSGWLAFSLSTRASFEAIPPLEISESMEFGARIAESFKLALRTNVSCLASLSSVLVKVGEAFSDRTRETKLATSMIHPLVFFRLVGSWVKCSIIEKRGLLPRDLWPVKAIFGWGADTSIYREQIKYYWGKMPYEIYGATEAGVIAMQGWNKNYLTFLADSVFLEFIPETEWLKSKEDAKYQPKTVLLNEVEGGEIYEIVLTSFYGMPFLRYRLGDLIRIVALKDEETGINLPQVVFHTRADDILDLGGFARLDEKTVWKAIANTGIRHEDWTMRKEYTDGNPVIHLYIELKERREPEEAGYLIHEQLKQLEQGYKDVDNMLGIHPLRVTLLTQGTFQRYLEGKQKAGADLAHLKPPHMNASDNHIAELILLSSKGQD